MEKNSSNQKDEQLSEAVNSGQMASIWGLNLHLLVRPKTMK
jgi:hypothetical protein